MHWGLLFNSLRVGGGATAMALLLGGALALWMQGVAPRLRGPVWAAALLSLAMPGFLPLNAWLDLFAPTGWVAAHLPIPAMPQTAAALLIGLLLWPISFVALAAAWGAIPRELFEAETGLRGWGVVRHILWPAARGRLQGVVLLTLVLALNQFSIPSLLQVKLLSSEIWIRYSTNLDPMSALAVGWPLLLLPSLVLLIWDPAPMRPPAPVQTPGARFVREALGAGLWVSAAVLGLAAIALSLLLPLAITLGSLRTWEHLLPAWSANVRPAGISFLFATATATAVLLLGILGAGMRLATRPRAEGLRRWIGRGAWSLYLVPGAFLGLGISLLFALPVMVPLRGWFLAPGLALVFRYLAFGWSGAAIARRDLDPALIDISASVPMGRWDWFRHHLWAEQGAWLRGTWYLTYVLSLWDVESLLLVQEPGAETLALRIFNLLHYGHNDQVNALCLHLLFLASLPAILWKGVGLLGRARVPLPSLLLPLLLSASGCSPRDPASGASSAPGQPSLFAGVEQVGGRGTAAGQFNKPRSVTVDRADNLYVVDMTGRVQKFSPRGEFLLLWQLPQTDLGKPKGMGVDRDGNILVVEPHYQRVTHFTPSGEKLRQWGTPGTNAGELTLPRSIAVNSRGLLYVTEYTTVDRVQAFAPGGQPGGILFGRAGPGPGEFNRPEGIAIDSSDRLFIADSCNHRIQVFDSGGVFLRSHGQAGSGPGDLSYPYDIAVDAEGRQFVCEFGNSRIQVFDAADRSIELLGQYGGGPGHLNNPWSLALDSRGNLYVADSGNHRVLKYIRRRAPG